MRYYRTTGLTPDQLAELVRRVEGELREPWHKPVGRPKLCDLDEAVEISCMYVRQNATEEFLGDMRHISQSTVSRIVTEIIPVIKVALGEFVPTAEEAIDRAKGKVLLVDGTITPCWSYAGHRELWSRKHGTTGFNSQLVGTLDGDPVYISDPLPGKTHDAKAFAETPVAEIVKASGGGVGDKGYQGTGLATPVKKPRKGELSPMQKKCNQRQSRMRAPIERVVAHFKSWRMFHTDYRRPYSTYRDSYDAGRALFFFSRIWGFA